MALRSFKPPSNQSKSPSKRLIGSIACFKKAVNARMVIWPCVCNLPVLQCTPTHDCKRRNSFCLAKPMPC